MPTTSSTFTTSQAHTLTYTLFEGSPEKPAVVFIHGLGSSQNSYYALAKGLSRLNFTCLIFDNYGASRSTLEVNTEPESYIDTTQIDTMELIQSQGFKNVILVGHSMGGMIVNYLASKTTKDKFPDIEISKIVLLAPVHPNKALVPAFESRVTTLEETNDITIIANAVAESAVGSGCDDLKKGFIRELVSRQDIDGYIYNCKVISTTSKNNVETGCFSGLYGSITCPVLIVRGADDMTTPWSGCIEVIHDKIKEKNSSVTVKTLEGIGHWVAVEDFESVLKFLVEFC